MKVLVIADALPNKSPGSRFRIEQWMTWMARQGVRCDYASFEDEGLRSVIYTPGHYLAKATGVLRGFARRFDLLRSVRGYDVVFLYEQAARLGPAVIERLIARTGIPIVYDFCDPIYEPYKSFINGYLSYLKFPGKTASICKMSAHVLVGNEELAEYARGHNPNVTIVPITIDTEEYQPAPPRPQPAVPTIGWTGSHSTVPHLAGASAVLRRLARERRFRLKVIGGEAFSLDGVEVDAQPWRAATEVADLQRFDIGIMPLPDDPWVSRRTHLKVRQYMGLGIPCVVSPLGVNRELIEDGENGFLVTTEDQWVDRLTRLLDDSALRARIGAAGRRTIEQRYSAALWAPRVLEILKSAAGSRAAASVA
jgi:glycosyltransferase involved in cell wall biosynthesis